MRSREHSAPSSPALRLASRMSKVVGVPVRDGVLAESIERRYRPRSRAVPAASCAERSASHRTLARGLELARRSIRHRAREVPIRHTRAASVSTSSGLTNLPSTTGRRGGPRREDEPGEEEAELEALDRSERLASSSATHDRPRDVAELGPSASQRVFAGRHHRRGSGGRERRPGCAPEQPLRARARQQRLILAVEEGRDGSGEPKRGSSRKPGQLRRARGDLAAAALQRACPERSTMGWTSTAEGPGRQGKGCRETCGLPPLARAAAPRARG